MRDWYSGIALRLAHESAPDMMNRSSSQVSAEFKVQACIFESESRRVAKELHDEVLPSLSRLARSIASQDESLQTHSLIQAVRNTVDAVRDLLGEIHPVDLEELGLVAALSNLCARYARLTGRLVCFVEKDEECRLDEKTQLLVYRALQCILRMFQKSDNDILIFSYHRAEDIHMFSIRCVDKRVSSIEWRSSASPEYANFQSWCAMANAALEVITTDSDDFPCDLTIRVPATRVEIEHKDRGAPSPKEFEHYESAALESQRSNLSGHIGTMVMPHFVLMKELALFLRAEEFRNDCIHRLHAIEQTLNTVLKELHPQFIADSTLQHAIELLVERARKTSQVEISLSVDDHIPKVELSIEKRFALYRATQEALNNVDKHSGATRTIVTLQCHNNVLRVLVDDNGRGFSSDGSTLSRGLRNIRERAAAIGASVRWQDSIAFERGTLVSICLLVG